MNAANIDTGWLNILNCGVTEECEVEPATSATRASSLGELGTRCRACSCRSLGASRLRVTEVPPDRRRVLCALGGHKSSNNAFHYLTLGGRKGAELVADPFLVLPYGQLTVVKAILPLYPPSFDQPTRYAARSACPVLYEIVQRGTASVGERLLDVFPARQHLRQRLGGRVLGFHWRGPAYIATFTSPRKESRKKSSNPGTKAE
jgi:hypothetical protein